VRSSAHSTPRKGEGLWGIGVDATSRNLGPQVLTSAMKRVDTSVYATIQQVIAGKFAGGRNMTFSLKNNGVGLGKISKKVPAPADVKLLQSSHADRDRQDQEHPDRRLIDGLRPASVRSRSRAGSMSGQV